MIVLNVTYRCKSGMREEFLEAIQNEGIDEACRREPGNLKYDYYLPVGGGDELLLVEKWQDEAALAGHGKMPHLKKLGELKPLYVDETVIERFNVPARDLRICVLPSTRAKEMIAFHHLCFPTDCWKDEDWQDLLSDPRAVYYALLDGERIVGNVYIYNWQGEDDYVKIMNLSVHPDYRGKGYAHRLLNRVTEEMQSAGMKRFCAETRASNKPMQKVFDDCGYRFRKEEDVGFENPKENGYKYLLEL